MKSAISLLLFVAFSCAVLAQEANPVQYLNSDGSVFSGLYHMYNSDEVLVYTADVKSGILDGAMTYFDEQGRIDQVGHYQNGQKQGKWEQFNDDGRLVGEAFYVGGLKHGIWSVWDDKGNKRYHMVYDQGNKVDVWKVYDENQVLLIEKTYSKK